MLTVPLLRRRLLSPPCTLGSITSVRFGSSSSNGRGSRNKAAWRKRKATQEVSTERSCGKGDTPTGDGGSQGTPTLSLIEQLFPEETKRHETAPRKASREIPRLPLDAFPTPRAPFQRALRPEVSDNTDSTISDAARRLRKIMRREDAASTETSVLVLRNASPNLVEEDFRRLIPQGRHMEGWTLEQGDILKVIPGRNLATLEQENYYYLLFSSKLSAFTYQGHATRIFRLAASHTPSSMTSPLAPPPGNTIDGMDAHSAIESFALVPASQKLDLRQLQSPLSPMMASIVKHQGYAALVRREGRMPYEVRLTLEGPQIQASSIRYILLVTAKDRSLAWSGGDEAAPKITKWEPRPNVSPLDPGKSVAARSVANANRRSEEEQMEWELRRRQETEEDGLGGSGEEGRVKLARRTHGVVYILGFHTEMAAQQFVRYWHRRQMVWKGEGEEKEWEDDLPPVAKAEVLW